ncbi:hypothetical protein BDV97DRAFT_362029 [Delphinella strobiligena]|nr:hypothetical protein BDV97DRAFT_362029 [Delphinella strobiligena]
METLGQALAAHPQAVRPPQKQDVTKTRRPHRPRKDYTNLDTVFNSMNDLKTALRQYMENANTDAAPEYISCAMTLSSHAILPLKSPLEGPYAQGGPNFLPFDALAGASNDDDGHVPDAFPTKTVQDLVDIQDLKERQIWQRAAAKGVVNAIQDLDGFKYCFNNNWTSKDDNGYRYSYTCLDSLENKDRHANGFRPTNAAKRRPGANTRGVRKPTYDCKGQIAVKFSGLRQSVEVVYKHRPIHKTVAERRPPPRKDSRRKDQSDDAQLDDSTSFDFGSQQDNTYLFDDPSQLNMSTVTADNTSLSVAVQPAPYPAFEDNDGQPPAKKARRRTKDAATPKSKRQKKTDQSQDIQAQDRPMSLAELLQQSMPANSTPQHSPHPLAPSWSGQAPAPHSGPTGHYQPHPRQQGLLQLGHPQPSPELRDVGRFSKLSVPCFKCKAASTECDGRQPICNSCHLRGTVCNYPSILRFDKQPMDSGWIQAYTNNT